MIFSIDTNILTFLSLCSPLMKKGTVALLNIQTIYKLVDFLDQILLVFQGMD